MQCSLLTLSIETCLYSSGLITPKLGCSLCLTLWTWNSMLERSSLCDNWRLNSSWRCETVGRVDCLTLVSRKIPFFPTPSSSSMKCLFSSGVLWEIFMWEPGWMAFGEHSSSELSYHWNRCRFRLQYSHVMYTITVTITAIPDVTMATMYRTGNPKEKIHIVKHHQTCYILIKDWAISGVFKLW